MPSSALAFQDQSNYRPNGQTHSLAKFGGPVTPQYDTGNRTDLQTIDLGLRAGCVINWRPHNNQEMLKKFLSVVDTIKKYESLQPGWDSYGGLPLNDRAVKPALELISEAVKRCTHPTVVPLCTGGLGLLWNGTDAELEIDVGPDGKASAVLEIFADQILEERNDIEDISLLFPLFNQYSAASI
jgi:hypothetical protein